MEELEALPAMGSQLRQLNASVSALADRANRLELVLDAVLSRADFDLLAAFDNDLRKVGSLRPSLVVTRASNHSRLLRPPLLPLGIKPLERRLPSRVSQRAVAGFGARPATDRTQ